MTNNILAIDWDNTCTDEKYVKYPYTAPIREGCKEYLQKLADIGYINVLWTTRSRKYKFDVIERIFQEDLAFNIVFMSEDERNSFHLKTRNKYLEKDKTVIRKDLIEGRDKILADIFIDDKNINTKEINWRKIYNFLKRKAK